MDAAERVKVLTAHLNKHGFPGWQTCPICRHTNWAPGEGSLMGVVEMSPGAYGASIGKDNVPLFLLVCTTCFYVRHFAIVPIMNEHLEAEKKGQGHGEAK